MVRGVVSPTTIRRIAVGLALLALAAVRTAKDVLERQGVKLPDSGDFLRLYPHVHDTDGFFAAVLEKRKP